MTMRRLSTGLLLTMLASAAPASAQTVINNGPPNGSVGWNIFDDFRTADDFTFASTLSFDLIRFWGLLPTGFSYSPNIFWEILDDGGAGTPGTTALASGSVLAQQTLRTSLDFGFDSWQFDLAVGTQSLGPGIYWLALHDGALGEATSSTLFWESTSLSNGSQFAVQFVPTAEWSGDFGGDLAFELMLADPAVVPEPATITLLGTGLLGLAAARRRRKPKPNN